MFPKRVIKASFVSYEGEYEFVRNVVFCVKKATLQVPVSGSRQGARERGGRARPRAAARRAARAAPAARPQPPAALAGAPDSLQFCTCPLGPLETS